MRLFRNAARDATRSAARDLYGAVVAQARRPEFYRMRGVPDTQEGRFDMIALHAFLILHRLKNRGDAAAILGQAFYDLMFADMDINLREMGVGDMGIGKRVRKLASAFHGRIAAYEAGLAAADDGPLADALDRNLLRHADPARQDIAGLVRYVRHEAAALAAQPTEALLAGRVAFGPAAGGEERP